MVAHPSEHTSNEYASTRYISISGNKSVCYCAMFCYERRTRFLCCCAVCLHVVWVLLIGLYF